MIKRTHLVSTFLVAMASIIPVRAATVFLSNINQPLVGNGFSDVGFPVWQSFITGPNAGGYELNNVRMRVSEQEAGSGFAVFLAADNGGSPGATLTSLSGPVPTSGFNVTNTYVANDYLLSPSTKYWIGMSSSSGYYNWFYPTSTTFVVQDGWSYSTRLFYNVPQSHYYFLEIAATPTDLDGGFYFQDFATYTNEAISFDDGSSFVSTDLGTAAEIRDATIKELQLTEKGVNNTRSAFMLPEFDTNIVYAFSAKWNMIVDGNFGIFTGGIGGSFNFGRLSGLNLIDSSYNQEFGYGEGISLGFQNKFSVLNGFYVRAGTNAIAYYPYDASVMWGFNSNKRHLIEVDWHYLNGLSLRVNQTTIFTNVPTYGYYPQRGSRFVWAARTDTFNQQVRLDNIVVATRGNLARQAISTPYFNNPGDLNPASAFDNNDFTEWQSYTSMNTVIGGTLPTQRNYRVYALTSAGDIRSRDPRTWRLEGSVDGGTNWTVLDSRTGYFANIAETRMYLATNVQAYRHMRLNIVTNNGHAYTFLSQLRSYRFIPISDSPGPVARAAAGENGHIQVVCSDDGRYAYSTITVDNNNINTVERSDDFGVTWTPSGAPNQPFTFGHDCSDDGRHVISVSQLGRVQYSTNFGVSFSQLNNSPIATFNAKLAISSNGSVMVMCLTNLAYSVNSGASWTYTNLVNSGWRRVTMSSDGQRIYAVAGIGVYSSTNSGASWFTNNVSTTVGRDIACSRDGIKAVLASDNVLYVTSNGGASWTLKSVPGETRLFRSVACSSDGHRMFALDQSPGRFRVFHSTDSGATWTVLFDAPGDNWRTLACSGDGQFLYIANDSGCDTFHLLPKPPYVEDSYATDIGPFGATMVAKVRPFGAPTRGFFSYGMTTNVGNNVNIMGGSSTGIEAITVSYPLTGLQTNTTYYFRPAATNTTGFYFGIGPLASFTTLSLAGLDSWRYQYFGTTNNTGNAADDADPEGDSNRNLLEFASGTSPSVSNGSPLFLIREDDGSPRVYFTKDTTADGHVVWQIESTPEPTNAWSNRNGAMQEVDSNGNLRTIEFTPDAPSSVGEQYRLKVSRP